MREDSVSGLAKANVSTGKVSWDWASFIPRPGELRASFRRFNSSSDVTRRMAMTYVWFPSSLRNVEDLLIERAINVCHDTVGLWWNRFGPFSPTAVFANFMRRLE